MQPFAPGLAADSTEPSERRKGALGLSGDMTPARLAKLQRDFDVAKHKAEDALAARDRAFESLEQAKMMAGVRKSGVL